MRTECVTKVWEFYRDSCDGYKEPMRKRLRELDEHVDRIAAENAKLREELADAPKCETCEAMLDCDECLRADGSHKERRRLSAENAKLRKLVRDYEHCSMHADCDRCEYDGATSTHCPLSPCFPDIDELRELGVEVDA